MTGSTAINTNYTRTFAIKGDNVEYLELAKLEQILTNRIVHNVVLNIKV
jgi:hypothetical protein